MEKIRIGLTYTYHSLCFAATFGLMLYCLLKYLENKDISIVDYKTFKSEVDYIYPAVTLCFDAGIIDNFTTAQDFEVLKEDYISFLNGDHWDDNFLNIDYDEITTKIEDYFLAAYVLGYYSLKDGWKEYLFNAQNLSILPPASSYYQVITDWYTFTPKFYISYRSSTEKCFTIDIPNHLEPVFKFEILFDSSIFPDGIRPDEATFGVKIHYPNQFFSTKMRKYSWRVDNGNNSLEMQFKLENVVVVQNRNKPESQCNEDWRNDDQIKMKNIMDENGCQPPHWKNLNYLENCTNKEQLSEFYYLNMDAQTPPCTIIQKVIYSYQELDFSDYEYEWLNISNSKETQQFKVAIEFEDSTFMKIEHVRAFDIESLIGNSGGYLGLFTGYALLQIPSLIRFISNSIEKIFSGQ